MKKLKILACHNYYRDAGGESLVFDNEVRGLQAAGHAVVVYRQDNTDTEQVTFSQKIAVMAQAYYARQTVDDIYKIIASEKPDIAFVQNVLPLISPSIYSALYAQDIPIIQATYNYRFICPDAHLYTQGEICERCVKGNHLHCVARRCYRDSAMLSAWYASILWLHRKLHTFAHKINVFMVPDQFLGNKLIEGGIPSEKIRVNPNPFFVSDYIPTYQHQGYLLYVGRLIRQKGVLTLVRAMALLKSDFQLVIIGQGELEQEVKALITELDLAKRVTIHGPTWGEDLKQIMAGAAALAVPSEWYDNLPLILCQANAIGKPVLAARINGIPEYVHDGENGFLFEPGNVGQLAALIDKIAAMSGTDFAQLSQTARSIAENIFDYTAHYQKLSGIFEELLDHHVV